MLSWVLVDCGFMVVRFRPTSYRRWVGDDGVLKDFGFRDISDVYQEHSFHPFSAR